MSEVPSNAMRLKKVGRRGMRYVAQRLGLLLVFALVLFGSAGRLDWPRAWGFLVLTLLLEGGSLTVLGILAPETLNQRGTFGPGVTAFDRVFAVVWLGLSMGSAAVAGLDAVRFGWSRLPVHLSCVGAAVIGLTFALGRHRPCSDRLGCSFRQDCWRSSSCHARISRTSSRNASSAAMRSTLREPGSVSYQ
jgi:hypothetical protein